MTSCAICGLTSSGAMLVEVAGDTYCTDHAPEEPCVRCGVETGERTMTGRPMCKRCQDRPARSKRATDREQASLGDW